MDDFDFGFEQDDLQEFSDREAHEDAMADMRDANDDEDMPRDGWDLADDEMDEWERAEGEFDTFADDF